MFWLRGRRVLTRTFAWYSLVSQGKRHRLRVQTVSEGRHHSFGQCSHCERTLLLKRLCSRMLCALPHLQNQGVTNLENLFPVFRAMATHRLLLLVHGEVTDPSIDIFDRESSFLPELEKVLVGVPELRVVLEHVTTRAGVQFVQKHVKEGRHLAATITAHHLLYSRNALFEGGLNPHLYCLPILKTEVDRAALLSAVLDPAFASTRHRFFCGTDSAPHPRANKEKSCGCAAGCFTAFATGELYLEGLVDEAQRRGLTAEESHSVITAFLTSNGAQFYDLPLNQEREIRFVRREWKVDESMVSGRE
jgi:dihydroorotase